MQKTYRLNPILAIQFIFKGKVIPDNLSFGKIGIHPKKDVITVMSTQAGGQFLLIKITRHQGDYNFKLN